MEKMQHYHKSNIDKEIGTYKPEDILKKLVKYSESYIGAPIEALRDWSFAGETKLTIDKNNKVVLIRYASDFNHLIKNWKSANMQEMRDSSEFNGWAPFAGAVHTSADMQWHNYIYPVKGVFRIPVDDFLELGRVGKIIVWNLWEAEIVISGDEAIKYLSETEPNINYTSAPLASDLPSEISIN